MPDLEDLKKLLSGQLPVEPRKGEKKKSYQDIEKFVRGSYEPSGKVYTSTEKYPCGCKFGSESLQQFKLEKVLAKYAGLSQIQGEDYLFLDTETTGLTGGAGTWAFLIGIGYFREDMFAVRQFFLKNLSGEKEMLGILIRELKKFKCIVSFNGKSYDLPLLRNRFIMCGHDPRDLDLDQLDLLHLARRFWKQELSSCTLGSLERSVLDFTREPDSDIPGEQIPGVYYDYLKDGNGELISRVFYHNRMDILAMLALILKINRIAACFGTRDVNPGQMTALGRLFEDQKDFIQAIRGYEHCLDQTAMKTDNIKRLSMLYKKTGRWRESIELWISAAEQGHLYAMEELAKVEEHRNKDPQKALYWTEKALDLISAGAYLDFKVLQRFQYRAERLRNKLHI